MSLAVFTATDVLLFYVVFEATLIPAYFLIGGFGRTGRGRAATKFLIYQLAGGLVMLASVIGLYVVSADTGSPSFLLSDLAAIDIDPTTQRKVLERIHRVLKPGGMLFVGHAENFSESRDLFTLRGKTVYERR